MTEAGIPTVYNGVQYRSRLEARWAAMFDILGWRYNYEPFDAAGYIPDFLITPVGMEPFLVEVKPVVTDRDYLETFVKVDRGLKAVGTVP